MTNQTKFKTVSVCTEVEAKSSVNDPRFLSFTQLDSDIYEVKCSKQSICYDLPLHIGFFVYGYAKLVLLRFYFEFLDHFFSRRDFALIQCDKDSLYFSISGESLHDMVKPELRDEYKQRVYDWLAASTCPSHHHLFDEGGGRSCCQQFSAYDKKTPGKFKLEFQGERMVALCSKSYVICSENQTKRSSKGLSQKQNHLGFQNYLHTLLTKQRFDGEKHRIPLRLSPSALNLSTIQMRTLFLLSQNKSS